MGRFAAIVILFAIVFAMVVPSYFGDSLVKDEPLRAPETGHQKPAQEADSDQGVEQAPQEASFDSGTSIQRGADGQFHIAAEINSQQIPFLVDTGADQVALTVDGARMIGIVVDPQSFEPVGMGAGGVVQGQRVTLESVRVAGHDIGSLDAVVLDGLTHNLLGQSVLRRVGRLELAGDTMTIH